MLEGARNVPRPSVEVDSARFERGMFDRRLLNYYRRNWKDFIDKETNVLGSLIGKC